MILRPIDNEKGIALVTALMLTLISMTMILALLYMITSGIKVTGAQKRYKTSLDAAHGGAELVLKDVLPSVMRSVSAPDIVTLLQTDYTNVGLQVISEQNCLRAKLSSSTGAWPAGCSSESSPKKSADMTMSLQASAGNPFVVYAKIVDTVKGNSETSGLQLEGAGVTETAPVVTPQHFPYMYRVEIQGERASGATEQANISVLYAY